jgi:hypothetical protein
MPGDLLRYLGGPSGFSWWWWVVAGLCLAVVIGWYAGVYVWTLPTGRLRRIPVIRGVHMWLLRRRFARAITVVVEQHRAGGISAGHAAGRMSRVLRSFLQLRTGARVQYMHIDDIVGNAELATAAAAFSALNDAQFSTERSEMDRVAHAATEVIRTWT